MEIVGQPLEVRLKREMKFSAVFNVQVMVKQVQEVLSLPGKAQFNPFATYNFLRWHQCHVNLIR